MVQSKQKQLNVRFSDEEHERLKAAATLSGTSVADIVRTAVNTYVQAVTGAVDPSAVLRSTRQSYAAAVVSNSNSSGSVTPSGWTVNYGAHNSNFAGTPADDPTVAAFRKLAGIDEEEKETP